MPLRHGGTGFLACARDGFCGSLALEIAWIAFVGLVAGVLTGLFGFGGGWLLVPLLVLPGAMTWGYASGTALCAILAGATGGLVQSLLGSRKNSETPLRRDWKGVGAAMAASAVVGTVLGKTVVRDNLSGLPQASLILDLVLAVVLVLVAARFFVGAGREVPERRRTSPALIALAGVLAFIPGILSGLVGIGGGIFYVPVLLFILGWSEDESRATSRLVVMASAAVGAALYGWGGGVRFDHLAAILLPAGLAGVVTSKVGFSQSAARRRLFRRLAGGMALLALVFTIAHVAGGSAPTRPAERGGPGAAALAAILPILWGTACGFVGFALRSKPPPNERRKPA